MSGRLLVTVAVYEDSDGTFGASWDWGGTWGWPSSSEALQQATDALGDVRFIDNRGPSVAQTAADRRWIEG